MILENVKKVGQWEAGRVKKRGKKMESIFNCDCCGKEVEREEYWQIKLRFVSFWNNPDGDKRTVTLCMRCGVKAAKLLGFQYDTGKILSIARKEQIDDVTVYGPHGGGIADIAFGGIVGANPAIWHAEEPNKPVTGAMRNLGGAK